MYIFLCILIVIACLLLIGAVLIQKSKGGGLASDYSSGNQYMGYRKTTDFIEKATWSLAIFVCVVSICASFAIKTPVTRSRLRPRHRPPLPQHHRQQPPQPLRLPQLRQNKGSRASAIPITASAIRAGADFLSIQSAMACRVRRFDGLCE